MEEYGTLGEEDGGEEGEEGEKKEKGGEKGEEDGETEEEDGEAEEKDGEKGGDDGETEEEDGEKEDEDDEEEDEDDEEEDEDDEEDEYFKDGVMLTKEIASKVIAIWTFKKNKTTTPNEREIMKNKIRPKADKLLEWLKTQSDANEYIDELQNILEDDKPPPKPEEKSVENGEEVNHESRPVSYWEKIKAYFTIRRGTNGGNGSIQENDDNVWGLPSDIISEDFLNQTLDVNSKPNIDMNPPLEYYGSKLFPVYANYLNRTRL